MGFPPVEPNLSLRNKNERTKRKASHNYLIHWSTRRSQCKEEKASMKITEGKNYKTPFNASWFFPYCLATERKRKSGAESSASEINIRLRIGFVAFCDRDEMMHNLFSCIS